LGGDETVHLEEFVAKRQMGRGTSKPGAAKLERFSNAERARQKYEIKGKPNWEGIPENMQFKQQKISLVKETKKRWALGGVAGGLG